MHPRINPLWLLGMMGFGFSSIASNCDPPKPGPNDFDIDEDPGQTEVPPPGAGASDPPIRRHLGDDECTPGTTNTSGDAFKATIQAIRTIPTTREAVVSADPFLLVWNICNRTMQPTQASTYSLILERSVVDTALPPLKPDGSPNIVYEALTPSAPLTASPVSMTLPVLPACSCLIQLVGINRDPPADANAPAIAEGISGAIFPRVNVAPVVDQGTQVFGHRFRIENAPITINPSLVTVKQL
jgi:hypothetical protein